MLVHVAKSPTIGRDALWSTQPMGYNVKAFGKPVSAAEMAVFRPKAQFLAMFVAGENNPHARGRCFK
jgi:hypothetical protein